MKKISKVIFLMVLLLSLCSCVKHIEDTNGESNHSLTVITKEDMLNGYPTKTVGRKISRKNNEYNCSIKKFSGVEELFSGSFKDEDVAVKLNSKVESGNAKIILVYNEIIIKEFSLNASNQIVSLTNTNGKIRILVAGESAKISVDFTVESTKSIS